MYAGTPSVFVRTTGCNLRCWFCDTPYTSIRPEGSQRDYHDVLNRVLESGCTHVVLTGGEPMLQPHIVQLTEELRRHQRFVTIETAGTIYRPVKTDLMSISPKLANSTPRQLNRWIERHERDRDQPDVVRRLIRESPYQLKFVVDRPEDLDEILRYLDQFPEVAADCVWLMPQGIHNDELAEKALWLAPASERLGFRFCPRRHIELYGSVRGT